MKSLFYLFCLIAQFVFLSCKKETAIQEQELFIKSIFSEFDIVVAGVAQLDDGNFLIAGYDQRAENSSVGFKLDVQGNVLWKKDLSDLNKVIWKIVPVAGTGFTILGIDSYASFGKIKLNICLYDNEGNIISCDSVGQDDYKWPHDMIRLSNGNYFIAGAYSFNRDTNLGNGIIITTSPTLQQLTYNTFKHQDSLSFIYCHGTSQLPDNTIAIAASVSSSNYGFNKYLFIIKTDLNGTVLSTNLIHDAILSETPNAMVPFKGGLLVVTSRMVGFNTGSGIAVNYFNDPSETAALVSGKINLVRLNAEGQFISRTEISGYPQNGMFNSIRQTSDGGFILCGTVNQLNSTSVLSQTKIYLVKLDGNLDVQWSKIINASYRTLGIDAIQTPDDGYMVIGTHKSLDKGYGVLVIKTDAYGNY